jgi:aarF domain-containing kinase
MSTKDALDSLRSPEQSEFVTRLPERESVVTSASELDDIALDDDELPQDSSMSSVPLTPKPINTLNTVVPMNLGSFAQGKEGRTGEKGEEEGFVSGGPFNGESVNDVEPNVAFPRKSHHKSASVTTIRSGQNVSLIEEKRKSTRISLDGQHALQEEFSRLQKEKQALQEQGTEEAINWGKFRHL